ncbi:MAG: DNA mismatch repair protein MutS, partial [Spirochaetales bacterium]|nr:DNA mismatch repair protein MutS [Spirochaetales bacterium]
QTALITLMAHLGSFVPAAEARIGLVDRIFCRVGASDNLARGESTFLVEMNEAAYILRNATESSLIIMDEIGRGTGTNDGLAIAWAVSEYILHRLHSRTLFATHFHELTLMEEKKMKNESLRVTEDRGSIVFLKKVTPGPSGSSYGIQVAKLAGIPDEVIQRSTEILEKIVETEKKDLSSLSESPPEKPSSEIQGELFSKEELFRRALLSLDLDNTTPMEALKLLSRWQKEIKEISYD